MSHYPASKTCDNCRHWDNDGMSPYGVCRKMPPTGSGWPRVSRKDWCGEWGAWVAVGPVPEAEPVMNPLLPYETAEANHAQAEAHAASNGLPPPYDPSQINLEKRRPGRPRKVQP